MHEKVGQTTLLDPLKEWGPVDHWPRASAVYYEVTFIQWNCFSLRPTVIRP